MTAVTALGLVASACTMSAFVPQVVKTYRSGSVADLSASTYALLTSGAVLWLAYGLFIGDVPIVLTNAVTLALLLAVDVQILTHHRRSR